MNNNEIMTGIWGLCAEYDIPMSTFKPYDEPHRFYHNREHIFDLWNEVFSSGAEEKYPEIIEIRKTIPNGMDAVGLAILFHDIVYTPRLPLMNESDSAFELMKFQTDSTSEIFDQAYYAILATKYRGGKLYNPIDKLLCKIDLKGLSGDMTVLMDNESLISKEYQFLDYKTYIDGRVKFLENYIKNIELEVFDTPNPNIPPYVDYLKAKKPNIGVYAGTFDPFHLGHYNILKKAEKIFDKVIILFGNNPNKNIGSRLFPKTLKYNQIVYHDGLLTGYLNSLPYEVTLIRGLRNTTDLQYELTQFRFLTDLKPDIKVVSIFCDVEYEHISSSNLKQLQHFKNIDEYILK